MAGLLFILSVLGVFIFILTMKVIYQNSRYRLMVRDLDNFRLSLRIAAHNYDVLVEELNDPCSGIGQYLSYLKQLYSYLNTLPDTPDNCCARKHVIRMTRGIRIILSRFTRY